MKLSIRNFKSIKKLDIEITGNAMIRGNHDSGKTTIADAILWCVLGTNVYNTPNFEPKPINDKGETMDLVTSVTIQYESLQFRKETSYKKDSEGNITGNDIKYYMNEVLCRKKDYDQSVVDFYGMGGNLLLVAFNPKTFAETLDISRRRKILLDMTTVMSRSEIIEKASEEDFSIENKEFLLKNVDSDLYKLSSTLTTMANKVRSDLKSNNDLIVNLRGDITDNDFASEIDRIKAIDVELSALNVSKQSKSSKVDNSARDKAILDRDTASRVVKDLQSEIRSKSSAISMSLDPNIAMSKSHIKNIESKLVQLRQDASNAGSLEFQESNCDTCGQEYPDDKIAEIKAEFEAKKKAKFGSIKLQGIATASELKERQADLASLEAKNEVISVSNKSIQEEIVALKASLAKAEIALSSINIPDVLVADNDESIDSKIQELAQERINIEEVLKKKTISDFAKNKIKEAEVIIKESQSKVLDLAKQKQIVDAFNKYEIRFIEDSVNSLFKNIKFKMFEERFNGEPKEICDPQINGVPYDQLNGRGKVMVAKDIAEVVASFYGNKATVLIDQRESANDVTINTGNSLMLQAVESFTHNLDFERVDGKRSELELV